MENALGFYGLALSCLSRDEPKDAERCRKQEAVPCALQELLSGARENLRPTCVMRFDTCYTLVVYLLFHLHQPGPNMYSQTHFPSSPSYVPCPGGSIRGGTCLDIAKLRLNMLEQNGAESPLNILEPLYSIFQLGAWLTSPQPGSAHRLLTSI